MHEFFRDRRRKVGVILLLMALAFVGGWIRSTLTCDYISANNWAIYSCHGAFFVGSVFSLDARSSAWDSGP